MNEGLISICDICKREFTVLDVEVKRRMLANDLEETFFSCPHCNVSYPVLVTDRKIRTLTDRQRYLEEKVVKAKRSMTETEVKIWEERQTEIKALLNELNGKVNQDAKQLS